MNSLNRLALSATVHCLTGCSIGEVLGMVLGNSLDWSSERTIVVSVVLAFIFGYALTMRPLLGERMGFMRAARLALASDTVSIAVMEVVDNSVMLAVPGAMGAPLTSPAFWLALLASLALAGVVAYPVNQWLIARGRGHAVVHSHHGAATSTDDPPAASEEQTPRTHPSHHGH